jgi:hypothetical protein
LEVQSNLAGCELGVHNISRNKVHGVSNDGGGQGGGLLADFRRFSGKPTTFRALTVKIGEPKRSGKVPALLGDSAAPISIRCDKSAAGPPSLRHAVYITITIESLVNGQWNRYVARVAARAQQHAPYIITVMLVGAFTRKHFSIA